MTRLNRALSSLVFAGTQFGAQIANLLIGLAVLHLLSPPEFALYTFIGALVGICSITSDLGTGRALITLVSRQFSGSADEVIGSVIVLRRVFLGVTLVIMVPAIVYVSTEIYRKEALGTLMIIGLLVVVVSSQARVALSRSQLAASGQLAKISSVDMIAAAVRAAAMMAMIIFGVHLNASWAVLAWAGATSVAAVMSTRHLKRAKAEIHPRPSSAVLKFIAPLQAGHLYLVIGGFIPVFSLGLLAGPEITAEYGALARLGFIVSMLAPIQDYLIHPFVSRGRGPVFAKRVGGVLLLAALVAAALLLSAIYLPWLWLLILGDHYSDLGNYVVVAMLAAILGLANNILYVLTLAGGDTRYQSTTVFLGIAVQIAIVTNFSINDLWSAYMFVIAPTACTVLLQACLLARNVVKMARAV